VPGANLIRAFLEQASAKGTKATVLKPLGWMMLILVSSTLSSFYIQTPNWVGFMFGGFTALTMLLYLIAYLFCLFTDKDALRSETYSIQKLAIEKGFVGDSLVGKIILKNEGNLGLIGAASSAKDEEVHHG
jgi:hypothetical protein